MKFLDIILIIIVIIAFGTTILIYSDNYDSYNNYENYSTICNTSKQNAPYEKPQTNVFFDKNGEYITLLDEMPKLNNGYHLVQIPCPKYPTDPIYHNHPLYHNEINNDGIICWQYNKII